MAEFLRETEMKELLASESDPITSQLTNRSKTGARPAICAILNRCRSELFDEVGRKIMGFYIFPCAATDPIKSEIARIAGLSPVLTHPAINRHGPNRCRYSAELTKPLTM